MSGAAGAAPRAALTTRRSLKWSRKHGQRGLGVLLAVACSCVGTEGRVSPRLSGTGIGRLAVSRSRSQVLLLPKQEQQGAKTTVAGKGPSSAFLGSRGTLRVADPRKSVQLSGTKFIHPARAGRITYGLRSSARLSSTLCAHTTTKRQGQAGEAQRSQKTAAPQRFLLLRHGQTNFNAEGRVQGSSDVSVLSDHGAVQAREAGEFLGKYDFGRVYVSPLVRAVQTLEEVKGVTGRQGPLPEEVVMDDLREIDLYEWQGMLKSDIKQKFPAEYALWRGNGASNFVLPSGNAPVVQLWDRARDVWSQVLADGLDSDPSEGPALVVAHNGIIQAMLCTAMGLDEDFFRTFQVPNCGVLELEWVPGEAVARRWRWLYPEEDPEWRIVSSG
mmetsp:Transcript_50677/g.123545  ORF Transcript_50677/g.123545 Transcript_50677/m.123545 type:complete len:386 (+) Transcript_50677:260-1417(+)